MDKFKPVPERTFLINVKGKWVDTTKVANQKTIDYYAQWYKDDKLTIVEDMGIPKIDCEIKLLAESKSRCYISQSYEVRSSKELTNLDFEILRAWQCFLSGQKTGEVISFSRDGEEFVYKLFSERDSGD
jgi:hypothetical protein